MMSKMGTMGSISFLGVLRPIPWVSGTIRSRELLSGSRVPYFKDFIKVAIGAVGFPKDPNTGRKAWSAEVP